MTPAILDDRLERFSLAILAVSGSLLRRVESADMAGQLRRAATAAYVNYGAACVARSHADFTSKIGVALEEADESRRWLRLLISAGLLTGEPAEALLSEAQELRAILGSSHLTAKQNRDAQRRPKRDR
jgi:four helix bundle protein